MTATVLSVLVLAAIALLFGAAFVMRRTGDKRQAILMVVLAIVAAINVAIWTIPSAEGEAPVDQVETLEETDAEPSS